MIQSPMSSSSSHFPLRRMGLLAVLALICISLPSISEAEPEKKDSIQQEQPAKPPPATETDVKEGQGKESASGEKQTGQENAGQTEKTNKKPQAEDTPQAPSTPAQTAQPDKSKNGGSTGTPSLPETDAAASQTSHKNWPSIDALTTSSFGAIRSNALLGGAVRRHSGMDIRAHLGWPVRALQGGNVLQAGPRGAAGITVEVLQENGKRAVYAHLSQALVAPGTTVTRGQHIGTVGCTGRTTGAHLHLAMRDRNGELINPRNEIQGPWELFDPPVADLKGPISGQACNGQRYPYYPPLVSGATAGGSRGRYGYNPRLRGTQQYLRMRKALTGVSNYKIPNIVTWESMHKK